MSTYEDDLSEERRLNELLRTKLKQSDERIATLTALTKERRDPFRDLLLKELGADNIKPKSGVMSSAPTERPQLSAGLLKLVQFVGRREVSLNELSPFIRTENIGDGKDPRRVMFDYKKTGLLENYKRGFYKLSAAGLKIFEEGDNSDLA